MENIHENIVTKNNMTENVRTENTVTEKIRKIAEKIEPELIRIRHELHQYPELGVELPKTHDIICRELKKIPCLKITEHAAEGSGVIAILKGEKGAGKTILLRGDIDALPIEEPGSLSYKSKHPGAMHACGHDGHATWIIGAAMILSELRQELSGQIKFIFQPGEEVGQGADALINKNKILEDVDMAFAAHGWPSIESGKIGIARRYAFGCVGKFDIKIYGKKGHASWPEETCDPIAAANELYQQLPSILTRKISGTEPGILSVTYMQAGDKNIHNIIPESCELGGTMRGVKKEVLDKIGEEIEKIAKAVCQIYGTCYDSHIETFGGGVQNAPRLLDGVKKAAAKILGKENVYFIEEDNLGGENFSEYSRRVPSVYMFIGIKPKGKEAVPGLHSPEYRFDDSILKGAAATFAEIAYRGCLGELES